MKSDELVRRINNGEIKDGTKIKFTSKNYTVDNITLCGRTLKNDSGNYIIANLFFIEDAEFEIVEEHKGWFKPEKGQRCWNILGGGSIYALVWEDDEEDCYRYKNHNVFRSYAEAQEYLDYKNALKEAEKPFVNDKTNYCLAYNKQCNDLTTAFDYHYKVQGSTYLGQDKQVAQAFIDKWEKQILKYEFDVWE